MARFKMDEQWIYDQYVVKGLSSTDIAEVLGKDPSSIIYWLKKYNIPRRPVGSMSEQRIHKNRVQCTCEQCGTKFHKPPARATRREHQFCSERCSQEWHKGENNFNYKGWKVDQRGRFSFEYRNWRKQVLERDRYTCLKCGCQENLHVHHVESYAENLELRTALINGITLCQKCHYEAHK